MLTIWIYSLQILQHTIQRADAVVQFMWVLQKLALRFCYAGWTFILFQCFNKTAYSCAPISRDENNRAAHANIDKQPIMVAFDQSITWHLRFFCAAREYPQNVLQLQSMVNHKELSVQLKHTIKTIVLMSTGV